MAAQTSASASSRAWLWRTSGARKRSSGWQHNFSNPFGFHDLIHKYSKIFGEEVAASSLEIWESSDSCNHVRLLEPDGRKKRKLRTRILLGRKKSSQTRAHRVHWEEFGQDNCFICFSPTTCSHGAVVLPMRTIS